MNYNVMPSKALYSAAALLLTTLFLLAGATATWAGVAEDVKEASRQYQQGKLDIALAKVNTILTHAPRDAQARFLKGLILTEQKKTAEAIQAFTSLTEDFPELPEPYNNLAVLYASQGNYDKAKSALELAIHTHPAYATAHENLGDIYAQLARRSYDKALQLDKNNTTAQSKLAMVKDLFSAPRTQLADAAKSPSAAGASKSEPPKAVPTESTLAITATAKSDAAKGASSGARPTQDTTPAVVAKAGESKPTNPQQQIKVAITEWANAWSAKNVAEYLTFYAPNFETPDKLERSAWENQRKQRIEGPASIKLDIKISKIVVDGNQATVVFRQSYKSDRLTTNNTKTLKMIRNGEKWQILSERSGSA